MDKIIKYKNIILSFVFSIIAFILGLVYIFNSSSNIIYSDYIRLTNSYIENVYNVGSWFSLDMLTRMPITFFCRLINVHFFHYNMFFDKILCVFFLCLIFLIINYYLLKNGSKIIYNILLCVICFSLNQWEMVLNGSGYAHYIAYFLFILYFYLIQKEYDLIKAEKILKNNATSEINKLNILLNIISVFSIIFVAGPYAATFVVVAVCLNLLIKKYKNILYIILPFCLYLVSNKFAVYSHSGMQDLSFFSMLKTDILYPIRFILKAVASSVLGMETFNKLQMEGINSHFIYFLAAVLILIYFYIFYKGIIEKVLCKEIDKIDLFNAALFIMCIGNYLIVFIGRYKYMNDAYGMQSRYYLQYMLANISVVIYFALNTKKQLISNIAIVCITAFIISPIVLTMNDEIKKMPSRKNAYENKIRIAKNIDALENENLQQIFEYNHETDLIINAFEIIRKYKLNVYYEK